jgi:DNA (cytosine-5)-methyltransferase 1
MKPTKTVKPEEVKAARKRAGLTQTQAAALIGYTKRAWQQWEKGMPRMRRALFQAFMQTVTAQRLWDADHPV